MGTSLTGLTPSTTYDALIKVGDNEPLTATLKILSDGLGNDSVLALSTASLQIGGATGATWDNTNKRLGIGTSAPTATIDILPPVQTATATQFDCMRVGYSNSTISVVNGSALQVQVATTGAARYSTTLRLSGSSDTSQAYLKGFDSNTFGVMLNRASSNLGLFSDNGIKLGTSSFAAVDGASSAQLHIKGSGSTSATTSLLVQNSAGSTALQVTDDGRLNLPLTGASSRSIIVGGSYIGFQGDSNKVIGIEPGGFVYYDGSNKFQVDTSGNVTVYGELNMNSTTKGFLPPRMTTTQRNAIASPAAGLMVYNTTTAKLNVYTTAWEAITSV